MTQQAKQIIESKKKVYKLRTWVKVAMGAVAGSVVTAGVLFGTEKVEYVNVTVTNGESVCEIIEEINGVNTCSDHKAVVYNLNPQFVNESRSLDEVRTGDVITVPVVSKRFIK